MTDNEAVELIKLTIWLITQVEQDEPHSDLREAISLLNSWL
jgi:hypothetical protein